MRLSPVYVKLGLFPQRRHSSELLPWQTGQGTPPTNGLLETVSPSSQSRLQYLCLHSPTLYAEPMTERQAVTIERRAHELGVHIPFLPLTAATEQHPTKTEADVLIQKLDRGEVPTAEWLHSLGRKPPVRLLPSIQATYHPSHLIRPRYTARPLLVPHRLVDPTRACNKPAAQDGARPA